MVSPAASDNDDDNNSTDLPSTPPCLQRLRASTRRAPPPEDDIDESSLREGILNNSSPAVPAVGAAARQRISGSAPLGSSSARIGIRADGSEDGLLVYSESEVFDMIIESATTTSASEEASRRCYRENFPLHEEDVTVASSLSGAEEMSATSDQRSHHHSAHQVAIASHRDKGTIRLGEGEPAVQSRGAGDNMDAGMVIPAGLKRSVTRPRQRVRRRVEKPQVQTGGARRQHQVTNPSSQGKANHDMRTSTPVTMPPRNNENVPTAMTGPGAEAKLAAATASIASTTRRETVTQEPVTTAVGNTTESRDEISARICEIGYRSVLNAEEASITAWRPLPQDNQGAVSQDGSWNSNTEEWPRREGTPELHERRSQHVRRTVITAVEERTPGEVASVHVREKPRSAAPNVEKKDGNTLLRKARNPSSRAMSLNLDGTLDTAGDRRTVIDRNMQAPMNHHSSSFDDKRSNTVVDTHRSDGDSNADVSPPLPLPDGGTTGSREIARPPSPPSIPNDHSATKSHSPPRHRDTFQGRRDRGKSSLLVPEASVKTAAERSTTQTTPLEGHRSMGFVERQELERITAERRREELVREEEEAMRQLASGSRWMNRSSRAILARSCSSPPCGGDRRSSSSPHGAVGRGQGPSVFERLARHASDNHMKDYHGYDTATWERETLIDTEESRARGRRRQPFTPMIDRRSSLIASRMPRRNEDGHGCLQQRLYWDGEEQVRRRERRIQLVDQAIREKAVSCYVNPGSERVLARRSRSRVFRFRSKMMEVLKVVDANRTGWLSFAGLECVLSECGMLPDQAPPEVCDDVLLGVWKELSEERPSGCGGGNNDSSDGGVGFDQHDSGTGCGVPADSLFALLTGAFSRSYNHEWADSIDGNGPSYSYVHTHKTGTESFSVRPANSQVWGGDEEVRGGVKAPEVDAPAAVPPCNEQFEALCQELSDILEANRRYRASIQQEEERQKMRNCDIPELQGAKTLGLASGRAPSAATPAQVAATSARFEEQVRARERKIELLRKAEETRKNAAHPFEPTMATAGTPGVPKFRRQAALTGGGKGRGIPPAGRGEPGGGRHEVVAEGQHTASTDRRTTEQREVDENCTFQPRLYHPLPLSPPRYPTRKSTHISRCAGKPEKRPIDSPGGTSTTSVDRATTCWNTQVERLKTGRMNRLRRLEEKQAIENRSEPLPPSVQQLFIDAGMKMHPRENYNSSGRFITTPGNSSSGAHKRSNGNGNGNRNGIATNNQVSSSTQRPLPGRCSSSASSSRLEGRLRARNLMKEKRNEEQARKSAEENAQLLKRKRVLARACKRSSAVVRLEAALAAREAERGRSGWGDPPVLIAEVEFVRQNWWALLPLWADTCPREAVDELTRQQHGVSVGTVAHDLEMSFADEIERAREQTTSLGLGLEQETESWASGGGKTGRRGKNRRAVPTVVLRVDVENDARVGYV